MIEIDLSLEPDTRSDTYYYNHMRTNGLLLHLLMPEAENAHERVDDS